MKKNAMLKIAAVLMVAVLLTTCAMSSTFAKYVTKGNDQSDNARVAKWGVSINTTYDGLFAKTYKNGEDVETVASATKVVAPGTETTTTIETDIVGSPEVDFAITVTKCDLTLTGWTLEDGTSTYCPLVFNVDGNKYAIGTKAETVGGVTYVTTIAALEKAVEDAIVSKCKKDFEANKDYVATVLDNPETTENEAVPADISVVVGWSWAYDSGNDANDTYLGNQAAKGDTFASTVKLEITQTATQID